MCYALAGMARGTEVAVRGSVSLGSMPKWLGIPLSIALIAVVTPIALLVQLLPLKKTADLKPADVAKALRDFIEGKSGEWDWDDFESVPITDPVLERIRQEAILAAPPHADDEKLKVLLAEVEMMVAAPR